MRNPLRRFLNSKYCSEKLHSNFIISAAFSKCSSYISICYKWKDVINKFWKRNNILRIGLRNVRTLQGVARSNLLAQELAAAQIPLCAITETHLPGYGCMELDNQSGYNLCFSGTSDVAARGDGLIMLRATKSVMSFDPVSDRVMRVNHMTERGVLSVVVDHSPTEQSEDEVRDL